ncbi:hypothetical protein A9264_07095 [Vibrio sp. UCD-FRSSP16_10]|uniref:DUF2301 domain-containing membrane protein n=1 Tax=unclassified Vibrio TaxID=2614977 RepID=UPI000800CBEA|nr:MULTISPECIES: DUF2301 domain-containing membrane protein [unclassified Vibrio]OBT13427.1 hypothetical protein A9264_07095 [Vibrio sp. UCD-FRSSP16_10]OBT17937.1 hypothetical protein A9260_01085 [Vibrio sp. UCD-FRSSP16_30]
MANPEHKEQLDGLDKLSVVAYRFGITLFSLALLLLSVIHLLPLFEINVSPIIRNFSFHLVAIAAVLSAANIHVYDKKARMMITWPTWLGLLLFILFPSREWLYIGFLFVTFTGIALKESYCFKIKALNFLPLLLVVSVLALWMEEPTLFGLLVAISGVIFVVLSAAKWRMPLHFDIGNKSNYQV